MYWKTLSNVFVRQPYVRKYWIVVKLADLLLRIPILLVSGFLTDRLQRRLDPLAARCFTQCIPIRMGRLSGKITNNRRIWLRLTLTCACLI
jgi:hypothetical protein